MEITADMLADESFDLEGAVRGMLVSHMMSDPAFREAVRRDDEEWERRVLYGDPDEKGGPPRGVLKASKLW